jgi:EAL and modified HD-GYP domain-containing signal transduction protein
MNNITAYYEGKKMTTDLFLARQPILNKDNNTVAYELLFRNSNKNTYPVEVKAHEATKQTIYNSFLEMGFTEISSGKKLLINLDEKSLHDDLIFNLPIDKVSFEILETIEPKKENIERIKKLQRYGFKIILDDFILSEENKELLKYCSMVKIDIQMTPAKEIKNHLQMYKDMGIKLLAEKIENYEELKECKDLGFHFYQGYFFKKPELLSTKKIESSSHIMLLAYQAICQEENYNAIANKISADVGLSEKFIKYANSYLQSKNSPKKINSVIQAISFIGYDNMLKFFNLAMIDFSNKNKKPTELIYLSMIRGQFLKLLFKRVKPTLIEKSYLAGFFYNLDALLDKNMEEVLGTLNLHEDIHEAIVNKKGLIGKGLELSEAIESNDIDKLEEIATGLGLTIGEVNSMYQKAIVWKNRIMRITKN